MQPKPYTIGLIAAQRGLRGSYAALVGWLMLVEPMVNSLLYSPRVGWQFAVMSALPLGLLAPIVKRANHASWLIIAMLVWLVMLAIALLAMLYRISTIWMYGFEALILIAVLYFSYWIIKGLPKGVGL